MRKPAAIAVFVTLLFSMFSYSIPVFAEIVCVNENFCCDSTPKKANLSYIETICDSFCCNDVIEDTCCYIEVNTQFELRPCCKIQTGEYRSLNINNSQKYIIDCFLLIKKHTLAYENQLKINDIPDLIYRPPIIKII